MKLTTGFLLRTLIWIFPVAAIALSAWLAYQYFENRGPEITIEFEDAGSIQANRTKVVYRGIEVGSVVEARLSQDTSKAIVTVQMASSSENLLKEKTRFIIVQPEVGLEGVSGLETLIKGPLIRIDPGEGASVRHFVGIEKQDVGTTRLDSVIYYLQASHAESIGPGDPVYYRGTKIGSVTESSLNKTGTGVIISIAVDNASVRVVRNNSIFFRKRAVEADLSLFGSEIKLGSLESMMKGGISVVTPAPAEKIANRGESFVLHDKEPEDSQKWLPELTF